RNGRDLSTRPRDVLVVDFFGLSESDARRNFPHAYQRILDTVRPERYQSARKAYRDRWWIFAEPRSEFRTATLGLPRYIATVMTSKHRTFTFLDADILPDQGLIAIASDEASLAGILSSRIHAAWALAAGGFLGVGND